MYILLEEEVRVAQAAGRSPLLQLTYPSTVKKQDCFGPLQILPANRQPSGYGSTFAFSLEFPPTPRQSMDSEELLPFSSSSSSPHTCSQAKTTAIFGVSAFQRCWPGDSPSTSAGLRADIRRRKRRRKTRFPGMLWARPGCFLQPCSSSPDCSHPPEVIRDRLKAQPHDEGHRRCAGGRQSSVSTLADRKTTSKAGAGL